jgi:NAD-dependent dihydropyrimidine dehydrogenase PreA subunit
MDDITRREAIGGATAGLGIFGLVSTMGGLAQAQESASSNDASSNSGATSEEGSGFSDRGYVPNLRIRNKNVVIRKDELKEMLLDEPEPEGDLTLPDGTVIPAIYVKLRNRMNRLGWGVGSQVDETSFQFLTYLWSEEDAKVWCEVPMYQWFNAFDYSQICGKSTTECDEILNDIAQRGLMIRVNRAGTNFYALQPYVAGCWEATELIQYYSNDKSMDACTEVLSQNVAGKDWAFEMSDNEFNTITVCPVSVDVVAEDTILPYMDWRERLLASGKIGVAACQCMIADHCLKGEDFEDRFPLRRCMYMNDSGEYFISIGAAEEITPEEAVEIGQSAVDAGMVPEYMTSKQGDIMCFCHSDECLPLGFLKSFQGYNPTSVKNVSAYTLQYDPDKCISCGACIDRCPMRAISFDDDNHCVHADICVRCGQCVTVCPVSARILKARDDFPYDDMPVDYAIGWSEDFAKQRLARGTLHDFVGTTIPEEDYAVVNDSGTRTSL